MISICDLSQPKNKANAWGVWELSQTYNAVLCTLSGADLLLWKLLPVVLLSVCGPGFSKIPPLRILSRDLSSQVGLSSCLLDFSSQKDVHDNVNEVIFGNIFIKMFIFNSEIKIYGTVFFYLN